MITEGMINQIMERITMDDRREGDRRRTSSSVPYRATFNHGAVEERFFALDDEHASAVAHEIAARRRLMFDAVQRIGT